MHKPVLVVLAVLTVVAVVGCAARRPSARLLSTAPPGAAPIASLATPLAPNENIRPTELRRGESSSVSLVQIRDREQPHIHTRYDLTVTLVRGSGTLWLDGAELPMRAGDVAFIPKATPHYFINADGEPAAALVVFAPPFTGPDQQPIP
jgi:mannose-6-phosphate isomerase-like protein (cupin superfamily)